MKILDIQPAADPGGGPTKLLAKFSLELTPEVRIHNMRLLQGAGGRMLTYASSTGGRRNATFANELADQITAAAVAALTGRETLHANRRA